MSMIMAPVHKLPRLTLAAILTLLALAQPAQADWCNEPGNATSYEDCIACCNDTYGGMPDHASILQACKGGCDTHHVPPTMYCTWVGSTMYCWLW